MSHVTSKDGTSIAYERSGAGPAVILVRAGFVARADYEPLAALLAEHFTVYNYDRRGQGESGSTLPFAVERELEDIEALVAVARGEGGAGPAYVYGVSSGGALALEAAAAGIAIDRLAVYEVPYCVAGDTPQLWRDYVEQLWVALAEGRLGDAIELFMRFSGCSDFEVVSARNSPKWPGLAAEAHKLAYDAASTGDGRPPADRLAKITQPTLVATGGVSADSRLGMHEMPADFYDQAADVIAASIPHTDRQIFEGQSHIADPKTVASVLERFFNDSA